MTMDLADLVVNLTERYLDGDASTTWLMTCTWCPSTFTYSSRWTAETGAREHRHLHVLDKALFDLLLKLKSRAISLTDLVESHGIACAE